MIVGFKEKEENKNKNLKIFWGKDLPQSVVIKWQQICLREEVRTQTSNIFAKKM